MRSSAAFVHYVESYLGRYYFLFFSHEVVSLYLSIKLLINELKESEVIDSIKQSVQEKSGITIEIVDPNDDVQTTDSNLFLSYLTDQELKHWLSKAKDLAEPVSLGVLPNESCPAAIKSLAISKDLDLAIEDALNIERRQLADLLMCNDEPMFRHLTVGDVFGLNNTVEANFWQKVKAFWRNLQHIRFESYQLLTGKEQQINTAATGILVLEHNSRRLGSSRINENLSFQDGKLNAFVLAPKSVINYLIFMFVVFFIRRYSMEDLVRSVGIIQTGKLTISSSGRTLNYRLDGVSLSAQEIDLQIYPKSVCFHLGRSMGEFEADPTDEEETAGDKKDTVRIQALPQGDFTSALLTKPISFFPRASDEDFKELFVNLRNDSNYNESFGVLMILSVILAATGLFMNSAPVIIGAMILAPLMAPIISLSMGVVRSEQNMLISSLKTIFWGVFTALMVAMVYSWLMPLHTVTPEIAARLNPNLLDLMVAIVSGIAGAYASARSQVAKSLAGVAIAVALIPPLGVTGIGLGWGDWPIVIGSFLLFMTNLVGITLAASLTFIVMGYSPVKRAKKGISYTFVLMGLISIPLMMSFYELVQKNALMQELQQVEWINGNDKNIEIEVTDVDLSFNGHVRVWVDITSREDVASETLRAIQEKMQQKVGQQVELDITRRILLLPDADELE